MNEQTTAPASATATVATGLESIGQSALATAQHLRTNPSEGKRIVDTMQKLNQQLTDLTQSASLIADTDEKLRATVEEAENTADWFKGQFTVPSGCGCCYNGNTSFAELLQRQAGE